MKYRWRELELLTVTTITNMITVIQFALIPLNIVKVEMQEQGNEKLQEEETGTVKKIEQFMSINMDWAAKLFNAPLEFAKSFAAISTPLHSEYFFSPSSSSRCCI
jgi:hypothetical protein